MSDEAPMQWGELKARVLGMLNASSAIIGAEDFLGEQIILCAVDIQDKIPAFRKFETLVFRDSEFVTDGNMSVGSLPFGKSPIRWFLIDSDLATDEEKLGRRELSGSSWGSRYLAGDVLPVDGRDGGVHRYFKDPNGLNFYVYPVVTSLDVLTIEARSSKNRFSDSDVAAFHVDCLQAFYAWVKAAVLKDIDKDLLASLSFRSGSFTNPGQYEKTIKALHSAFGNGVTGGN